MWKYIVEQGRPQMTIWQMRIAFWTPEGTNTGMFYNTHCFSSETKVASILLYSTLPVLFVNVLGRKAGGKEGRKKGWKEGRKEGRKKEGRKKERKEGRKEGERKKGRKEGRKERNKEGRKGMILKYTAV
jgi:hypothetical protein